LPTHGHLSGAYHRRPASGPAPQLSVWETSQLFVPVLDRHDKISFVRPTPCALSHPRANLKFPSRLPTSCHFEIARNRPQRICPSSALQYLCACQFVFMNLQICSCVKEPIASRVALQPNASVVNLLHALPPVSGARAPINVMRATACAHFGKHPGVYTRASGFLKRHLRLKV
jgi:hypothetical protein